MSALAALFHRDGRTADPAAVWAMLAAVPYRGPDGMAVQGWETVVLGHAKLAVTPEDEAEQQPLVSPRTGCVIVADVRLDNRAELLAALADPLPPTVGDAELILRAYEAWGPEAAARLLGDFAFVIWDPGRQRLVCGRDTSGQRTLYYRIDGRTFAAASEIHQLLQDPAVAVAPNEERVRDFLVPLNLFRNLKDQEATFFAGVDALPAGHLLVVDREQLALRRYWRLEPREEIRYRTDEEYAEHYRALFCEVVRARLRSARPLGAMLSGGLDSSSVVCTAQELYRAGRAEDHGFLAFSFVFDPPELDERSFVQDVQAKYGFRACFLAAEEFSGRLQLEPRGFQVAPQVLSDGRDALLHLASQAGIRAILAGDVADAYVSGSYLVFDSLLRQGKLRTLQRYWQAYRRATSAPVRRTLLFGCVLPLLPLWLQRELRAAYLRRNLERLRRRLLPGWMPEPLRQELSQRHLELCLEEEHAQRFASPAREYEARLLDPPEVSWHPAPWPVEIWRPYADRRLQEFMLAIPPEQKFAPHPESDEFYAGSKWLVRRAMRGILPESIRTRRAKTVFNGVFEREVARQWPLYEAAFGPSGRSELAVRGYVDPALFWARLQELRDGGGEGADLIYLMQIVALESWLRVFRLPRPQLVTMPPARRVSPRWIEWREGVAALPGRGLSDNR